MPTATLLPCFKFLKIFEIDLLRISSLSIFLLYSLIPTSTTATRCFSLQRVAIFSKNLDCKFCGKSSIFLLHFFSRCVTISKVLKIEIIRVWRSLVSRLTGGQEAAGSSPVTRTIFSIKTADFQRFLSFSRTFLTLLFFVVISRPRFDPYQRNFRERRLFFRRSLCVYCNSTATLFQMVWAMNPPIRSAASLRISPVTWA